MKNNIIKFLVTISIFGIIGCGGGNANSNPQVAQNGVKYIGYYVDEVITGVLYVCTGENTVTQTGTTGANGEFYFVTMQTCVFSAGGVEVEVTGVLDSNETVVSETDSDDLGYLLTLDNNGNPNDGILITPAVESNASTYNTNNANSETSDVDLSDMSGVLSANDGNYTGSSPSTADVATQVTNAGDAGCVRSLIGGQTWYIVMNDPNDGASMTEYIVDVPVANTVVTPLTPGSSPNPSDVSTEIVTLVGDQLWIEDDGKDFAKFEGCGNTAGTPSTDYIDAYFYSGSNHASAVLSTAIPARFYSSLSDAQAYHATL